MQSRICNLSLVFKIFEKFIKDYYFDYINIIEFSKRIIKSLIASIFDLQKSIFLFLYFSYFI